MTWTTPATAASGELTSDFWNTQVRDNFKALGDPWASYSPTLGNWTVGNGTLTGAYSQTGKLVQFRVKLVIGSTTGTTGSPTFSLPVTAVATRAFSFLGGAYDSTPGDHYGLAAVNNNTTTVLFRSGSTALSSTVPFSWAAGDELYMSGTYESV